MKREFQLLMSQIQLLIFINVKRLQVSAAGEDDSKLSSKHIFINAVFIKIFFQCGDLFFKWSLS